MQKPEETIKFVKEYLADPSCKTEEEVKANSAAAYAYCDDFIFDDAAAFAAVYAADAVTAYAVDAAQYWVKDYEKLNGKLQDAKKEK